MNPRQSRPRPTAPDRNKLPNRLLSPQYSPGLPAVGRAGKFLPPVMKRRNRKPLLLAENRNGLAATGLRFDSPLPNFGLGLYRADRLHRFPFHGNLFKLFPYKLKDGVGGSLTVDRLAHVHRIPMQVHLRKMIKALHR